MTGGAARSRGKAAHAAGIVAIVLAVSMGVALNVITAALLWAAVQRLGVDVNSGISDNGVQILLAWGGGIISVLAGYIGFIIGRHDGQRLPAPPGQKDEPL